MWTHQAPSLGAAPVHVGRVVARAQTLAVQVQRLRDREAHDPHVPLDRDLGVHHAELSHIPLGQGTYLLDERGRPVDVALLVGEQPVGIERLLEDFLVPGRDPVQEGLGLRQQLLPRRVRALAPLPASGEHESQGQEEERESQHLLSALQGPRASREVGLDFPAVRRVTVVPEQHGQRPIRRVANSPFPLFQE